MAKEVPEYDTCGDADVEGMLRTRLRNLQRQVGGIYDVLHQEIRIHSSVEVPEGHPDVRLHHICNNSLSSPPNRGIGFVVNDRVKSTYNTHRDNRTYLVDFPE